MHTQKTDSKLSLSSIRNDEALGYNVMERLSEDVVSTDTLPTNGGNQTFTFVCKALGLEAKHVMERLDDGVVSTDIIIDRLGRNQNANFVNETDET